MWFDLTSFELVPFGFSLYVLMRCDLILFFSVLCDPDCSVLPIWIDVNDCTYVRFDLCVLIQIGSCCSTLCWFELLWFEVIWYVSICTFIMKPDKHIINIRQIHMCTIRPWSVVTFLPPIYMHDPPQAHKPLPLQIAPCLYSDLYCLIVTCGGLDIDIYLLYAWQHLVLLVHFIAILPLQ